MLLLVVGFFIYGCISIRLYNNWYLKHETNVFVCTGCLAILCIYLWCSVFDYKLFWYLCQELGRDAFNCPELDMIMSEFNTIENWRQRGEEVVGCSASGDVATLLSSLLKVVIVFQKPTFIFVLCREPLYWTSGDYGCSIWIRFLYVSDQTVII